MASRGRTSLIPLVAMATFLGVYTLVPTGNAPATISASDDEPATRRNESSQSYRNCAAARAAGAAPIYAGQPGYRGSLDRDGDGIACEPYRRR